MHALAIRRLSLGAGRIGVLSWVPAAVIRERGGMRLLDGYPGCEPASWFVCCCHCRERDRSFLSRSLP